MVEKIHWVKTHCARMDHGGCGLLVGIRDGRIVEVKGNPNGVLNKGYICSKGRVTAERLNHPKRLRYPLKRRGKRGAGHWSSISWTEAIDIIKDKLLKIKASDGARSVAFCQGMPKGLEHFVLIRLANVFGSPNVVAVQDVCHAPREISGFHTCGFYPVADFRNTSRLIMLWGSNVTSTNEEGQICSQVVKQIRRGTDLVVIDPRRTDMADRAKFWLQLRPGTDAALALAFLNVIIGEELYDKVFVDNWTSGFTELAHHVNSFSPERTSTITDIPASLIREAARAYATSSPATIGWGNAIEQNTHSFDTSRALTCLMAICGNLDIPGGNVHALDPSVQTLAKFVRSSLLPEKKTAMLHAHYGTIKGLMTVPPTYFKKAILEGIPYQIRGAYMQGTNPLVSYADSYQTFAALNRLEFFAVSDIFMTPTASLADIVLPAATHLEFDDIGHYGLGHGYILARPKVVDPPSECWPDIKILNILGRELTGDEHWYDDHHQLLDEVLEPAGLSYDAFCREEVLQGVVKFKKYQKGGFRTPSGKVELSLSQTEALKAPELPNYHQPSDDRKAYPLILTGSKSRHYLHSSYRWIESLRRQDPVPIVLIHPRTAAANGIISGCRVVIETNRGSIVQIAKLSDTVKPGVIAAAIGWWFPEKEDQPQFDWLSANYNILTTTGRLGKEFGSPNLKGIPCRIRVQKQMDSQIADDIGSKAISPVDKDK